MFSAFNREKCDNLFKADSFFFSRGKLSAKASTRVHFEIMRREIKRDCSAWIPVGTSILQTNERFLTRPRDFFNFRCFPLFLFGLSTFPFVIERGCVGRDDVNSLPSRLTAEKLVVSTVVQFWFSNLRKKTARAFSRQRLPRRRNKRTEREKKPRALFVAGCNYRIQMVKPTSFIRFPHLFTSSALPFSLPFLFRVIYLFIYFYTLPSRCNVSCRKRYDWFFYT